MKMGTILSPSRYDRTLRGALTSAKLRLSAIFRYALPRLGNRLTDQTRRRRHPLRLVRQLSIGELAKCRPVIDRGCAPYDGGSKRCSVVGIRHDHDALTGSWEDQHVSLIPNVLSAL